MKEMEKAAASGTMVKHLRRSREKRPPKQMRISARDRTGEAALLPWTKTGLKDQNGIKTWLKLN